MSRSSYGGLDEQTFFCSPIKVMVVDNKNEALAEVEELLASYPFEVTCVNSADAALTMLTDEKADFDIILLDSNLRDVEMIKFLQLIKDMDILKIVMKEDEDDDAILLQALDNGALLVVKRKLASDFVTAARQYVIRKRIQKFKKFGVSSESDTKTVESSKPGNITTNVTTEKKKVRKCYGNINRDVELLENERVFVKRRVYTKRSVPTTKKTCVKWTKELHSKFLSVVQELGEGKCFPKTILHVMGVPGLTRMQVASHLQKCRHGWQFARKRGTQSATKSDKLSSIYSQGLVKYGRMPLDVTHAGNPTDLLTSAHTGRMPFEEIHDGNPGNLITSTKDVTLTMNRGKFDLNLKPNQSYDESSSMNSTQ